MKKLVLAVAALGLISLTSCKKEYTCACTIFGTTTEAKTAKVTKSDAKSQCEALDAQAKPFDGSCSLK